MIVTSSVRISPAAVASTGLRSRIAITLPQATSGLGFGSRLNGLAGGACMAQEYASSVDTRLVRPGAKSATCW
jgi:hypothetical protein